MKISISCQIASELSSRALDERLSWFDTVRMWAHVALCAFCNRFRSQVARISRVFKSPEALAQAGPGLKPEALARLKKAVQEKVQH